MEICGILADQTPEINNRFGLIEFSILLSSVFFRASTFWLTRAYKIKEALVMIELMRVSYVGPMLIQAERVVCI